MGDASQAAKPGDVVQFEWTLRRRNGYFIFSTQDCGIGCGDGSPSFAVLGETNAGQPGGLILGLDDLLTGMRPGGKRRALIPASLGYTAAGAMPQPLEFGQQRQILTHNSEGLIFEVRLVKARPSSKLASFARS